MELNNSFFSQLQAMPKLLVFDLDNTLWTPELYQLRKPRNAAGPSVDWDIRLFEDARRILDYFAASTTKVAMATPQPILPQLAVASRTSRAEWAHQLLDDFTVGGKDEKVPLRELFPYIEIQTGSKKRHFASLREATGLTYSEMLFFDDSVSMNLNEISQLGVLCCHTPRGMTMPHFIKALQKYNELKAGKDARHWMGYVLNNDNLGIHNNNVASDRRGSTVNGSRRQQNGQSSSPINITPGKLYHGRIKFFSVKKRFGFVVMEEDGDNLKTEDYFFHESHVPDDMIRTLRAGDQVSFHLTEDSRTAGRWSATLQSFASSSVADNNNTVGGGRKTNEKMVEMPCFSMPQPFCALLLNGIKTVESRNQPMFQGLAVGTRVLLVCGRKDWHDQVSYRELLSTDYNDEDTGADNDRDQQIQQWGRLPRGFAKGHVVGILTLGRTRRLSNSQRSSDAKLQRQVLAYADDIGEYCTEVSNAAWLTKSFPLSKGQPGIFTVKLPKKCLPPNSGT